MDPQVLREAMTAYQAVYDEDLRETIEFENWVNALLDEGYDLSDYTWEDMYKAYIEEQGGRGSSTASQSNQSVSLAPIGRAVAGAVGSVSQSLSAANRVPSGSGQTNRRGGGTSKPVPSSNKPTSTATPSRFAGARDAAFARARQIQGSPVVGTKPTANTPAPTASRPTATAAPRPTSTAAPRPGTTPGSPKPGPTATATAKPRPKDTSITDMIGRSQVRQGAPINTGNKSSDIRSMAARGSVGATPTTSAAKPAPAARPMGSRKPGSIVSGFDMFDVVKGHLLDEGYADTEEAALAIMANMSEEWRESIIEGGINFSVPSRTDDFNNRRDELKNRYKQDVGPRIPGPGGGGQYGEPPAPKAMGLRLAKAKGTSNSKNA